VSARYGGRQAVVRACYEWFRALGVGVLGRRHLLIKFSFRLQLAQSDKISHFDMVDDRIDIVISHIISLISHIDIQDDHIDMVDNHIDIL